MKIIYTVPKEKLALYETVLRTHLSHAAENHTNLSKELEKAAYRITRDEDAGTLTYEGLHDLFALAYRPFVAELLVNGVQMAVDYATPLKPYRYYPDDKRLPEYMTYQEFLTRQATWEEFAQNDTSGVIPIRFMARYVVFKHIGPGSMRTAETFARMEQEYGEDTVAEVLAFMRRSLVQLDTALPMV